MRCGTLFARTATTISLVSMVFFVFTLVLIGWFIVIPLAQRTADNLATLMVVSANSWEQLSEEQWASFNQHMGKDYRLKIEIEPRDLVPRTQHVPFFKLLENALQQRLGKSVQIQQSLQEGHEDEYWGSIPTDSGSLVLVGFSYNHDGGMEPPLILLLILIVGGGATILTSVILASRLTRPLERLSQATRHVGCGVPVPPLPIRGPRELADLARAFNAMTQQVQDLLANRTTLLAGISHDLRTPLTRMELALEMLGDDADPTLVEPLKRDLQQMNRLIGLFLEIAKGLQEGERREVEIGPLLEGVINDFSRNGAKLEWQPGPPCKRKIHSLALQRIANNLIENAIRYGGDQPILVRYEMVDSLVIVEVLDRGPGIPPDQSEAVFQPFYRLEKSRNSATGGSGLGLSIVRQLASANGCRVELLPREGGGTNARITITQYSE